MVGSLQHVITYDMHYAVCIDIPYGRMAMSHDHLIF